MHSLCQGKILAHIITLISLMGCIQVQSERGSKLSIDAITWSNCAAFVHNDHSLLFKHQEIGNILISNYSIDDGLGSNGDDLLSSGKNWASCNMSSTMKTLATILSPKLWLPASMLTSENISLAVELEDAYEIFKENFLKH